MEFRVTLPGSTPAGSTVFIVGDQAVLGGWDPAAVPMTSAGAGLWTTSVHLPCGTTFEYKYTRGGWDTVEKAADGSELANRTGAAVGATVIDDSVASWADEW